MSTSVRVATGRTQQVVNDGPWVEKWLSPARFGTYLRLAGGDRRRALELHEWTAKINAALLHDFGHLEVGLRNLYDAELQRAVVGGENHWTEPASFHTLFPDPHGRDRRTHTDLAKAREKAGEKPGGPPAPGGKVLAEFTFGFWVLLTSHRNEATIWAPYLHDAYPNGSRRHQIHNGLDELRRARNRVAHHEPARPADINQLLRRVRRYARYVSTEVADYIDQTSDVASILAARP